MKTEIILTCKNCGKKWLKRGYRLPKYCPGCNSSRWNRDRLKTGPRAKYDLSCVLDGKAIFIKWENDMSGWLGAVRRLKKKAPGVVVDPGRGGLVVWIPNRQGAF